MDTLRQSGIHFEAVYLRDARLADRAAKSRQNQELKVSFEVSSRLISDDVSRGEVLLSVVITPDDPEPRFEVEVKIAGLFRVDEAAGIPREKFFSEQAPALLVPFAREAIANLTARTQFGPVLIPPINLRAIVAESSAKTYPESHGRESG